MIYQCPICDKIIYAKSFKDVQGVEVIKTKRHTTVLVHTKCIQNRKEKQNEHS